MDTTPRTNRPLTGHKALATRLDVSMDELARAARVDVTSLLDDSSAPPVQAGLHDIERVLARAVELDAQEPDVIAWFRRSVLPGWGKTAQQLVELGHAEFVLEELEAMEHGIYS